MYSDEIEVILSKAMGLKIDSIGKTTLDRAVNKRLGTLGLQNVNEYIDVLKSRLGELKELIEEVVIPETWFFRDKEPFKALVGYIYDNWITPGKKDLLRILSAPCSTGEEPYSIAITLLQAGFPANQFHVDAVDISGRAIAHAKKAAYTNHSFRDTDLSFRNIYFRKENNQFILKDSVRNKVHFFLGNILNPNFMKTLGIYDVIFCRNVLIYLDSRSQKKAIDTLDQLLKKKGILFTGHSESGLFSRSQFTMSPYRRAFAFVKKAAVEKTALFSGADKIKQNTPRYIEPPKSIRPHTTSSSLPDSEQKKAPPPKPFSPFTTKREKLREAPEEDDMSKARQLADQGKLDESAAICHANINKFGPSAQSYFLLGLINDIKGDSEKARELLKKTIYLDPEHIEAMVLLGLISKKLGDDSAAANYKRRAERLQKQSRDN